MARVSPRTMVLPCKGPSSYPTYDQKRVGWDCNHEAVHCLVLCSLACLERYQPSACSAIADNSVEQDNQMHTSLERKVLNYFGVAHVAFVVTVASSYQD